AAQLPPRPRHVRSPCVRRTSANADTVDGIPKHQGEIPMPDTVKKPPELWAELNDRQRLYLKTIYDADQRAEAAARTGWTSAKASEWRWVTYSIKAPKELVGRTTIQSVVERAGKLDTGAGSSLAALRRR